MLKHILKAAHFGSYVKTDHKIGQGRSKNNIYVLVQFRCIMRIVLMATLKSTTGQTMIVESNKYGDRPHVAFEGKKWVKDYIQII